MTRTTIVIAAGLALAVALPVVSAQAQSPRTFVSAAGSDGNPCTFAAPCRHFQAAVTATSLGGEVDALDPAGYGPITISQAITIEGQGWSYIAPPTGGNAITVNAVSGKVAIHGVSLNGVGITGTTVGIQFNGGGSLTVRDSVIRNFSGSGIICQPNASSSLFVSDTLLADNGTNGIFYNPSGSGLALTVVLNRVEANNNASAGIDISGVTSSGGSITATVSESVLSQNGSGIIASATLFDPLTNVTLFHSVVANNQSNGILSFGGNVTITVAQSAVTGNTGNGWNVSNGSVIQTYQDNYFNGNGANSGSLTNVSKQ